MSWFHFTKQERLKRNRTLRRELAEQARKHAADNPYDIRRQIDEALSLAVEEERTFIDYFGEQMPKQVEMSLHLEMILWRRLQAGLEREMKQNGITHSQYQQFQQAVRALLMTLINLLHAEEEMVTSCLVQHYITIAKDLQAESARVSL
jgi:ribosomal protein S4